jgi:hypothetical protein
MNLFGQNPVSVTGSSASSGVSGSVTVATSNVVVSVGGAVASGTSGGAVAVIPAIITTPETPRVIPLAVTRVPSDARITNLSTRARVAGDSSLVTGFAISGGEPRTILVRAVGPTLGVFGLNDPLAAPHLKLYDSRGAVLLENAGWSGSFVVATAMAEAGAFPFPTGSADSALVATLPSGTYSVEVSDDAARGGVVLTEIYDVQKSAAGSRLTNVSTRGAVAPAGGELISGFVVSGTQPRDFLVRGVGPALAKFNVGGVLADPALTLFGPAGTPIATNDNWSGSIFAAAPAVAAPAPTPVVGTVNTIGPATAVSGTQIATTAVAGAAVAIAVATAATANPVVTATAQTGAFALDVGSADSALVVTLNPGAYTVQVNGTHATSGTALLEIYELP